MKKKQQSREMLYGCEDRLYLAHKDLRMTKIEQRKINYKRGTRRGNLS